MFAKRLNIIDRNRVQMRDLASIRDFTYEVEENVDAQALFDSRQVSLYCLDLERREAIFIVLPESIDLSQVPFVYQAQFDNAEYLITLAFSDFLQLTKNIEVEDSQLICIHSVGRCGSTLLIRALNLLDYVSACSEPDVFSSFVTLRHLPLDEQIPLLQACYRYMFRHNISSDASRYVVKFRNHCADIMDVFVQAFPNAKHLFMYRNALDWVASLYRIIYNSGRAEIRLSRNEAIEQHRLYFNLPIHSISQLFDSSQQDFSITVCRALLWVQIMNRHAYFYQQGLRPIVIRYEDLVEHRNQILTQLLELLELPLNDLEIIIPAFEYDSQAGTKMARDNAKLGNTIQLPVEEIEAVEKLLAKQPIVNQPDHILSGTVIVT